MPAIRRIVQSALLGTAALFSSVAAADACSCISFDSPAACEMYRDVAVAFVGRAVAVPPNGAGGRVRFRVSQAMKGVIGSEVDVLNDDSGVGCGYQFHQGEDYVVFAARNPGGNIVIAPCSDTVWMVHVPDYAYSEFRRRAAEAVSFAESLRQPAVGGRIFGEVGIRVPLNAEEATPVDGATVILRSSGREQRTTTVRGRYEFIGLAPGTYRVSVTMPDGRTRGRSTRPRDELLSVHPFPHGYAREYTRRITITDARGCGYAPFEPGENPDRGRRVR